MKSKGWVAKIAIVAVFAFLGGFSSSMLFGAISASRASSSAVTPYREFAQLIQATLNSIAILAGAWWFFLRRRLEPRAVVSHEISCETIDKFLSYLIVNTEIENKGGVRFPLKEGRIQIMFLITTVDQAEYFKLPKRPDNTYLLPAWHKHHVGDLEINPDLVVETDEKDSIFFGHTVPASARTFRVSTSIKNEAIKKKGIYWNTTTDFSVKGDPATISTSEGQ